MLLVSISIIVQCFIWRGFVNVRFDRRYVRHMKYEPVTLDLAVSVVLKCNCISV